MHPRIVHAKNLKMRPFLFVLFLFPPSQASAPPCSLCTSFALRSGPLPARAALDRGQQLWSQGCSEAAGEELRLRGGMPETFHWERPHQSNAERWAGAGVSLQVHLSFACVDGYCYVYFLCDCACGSSRRHLHLQTHTHSPTLDLTTTVMCPWTINWVRICVFCVCTRGGE